MNFVYCMRLITVICMSIMFIIAVSLCAILNSKLACVMFYFIISVILFNFNFWTIKAEFILYVKRTKYNIRSMWCSHSLTTWLDFTLASKAYDNWDRREEQIHRKNSFGWGKAHNKNLNVCKIERQTVKINMRIFKVGKSREGTGGSYFLLSLNRVYLGI